MLKILLSDGSLAYWSAQNAPQGNWTSDVDEMGVFRFFVNSADVSGSSMFDAWADKSLTIPFNINLHQVNWYAPVNTVIDNNNTYQNGGNVTPSDSVDLATAPTRGLYIGTGGNVAVNLADGSTITLNNVPSGTLFNLSVSRVLATGTTASNIVALY